MDGVKAVVALRLRVPVLSPCWHSMGRNRRRGCIYIVVGGGVGIKLPLKFNTRTYGAGLHGVIYVKFWRCQK